MKENFSEKFNGINVSLRKKIPCEHMKRGVWVIADTTKKITEVELAKIDELLKIYSKRNLSKSCT